METSAFYKLLTEAEWKEALAQGYAATSLDEADGYIHLSTVDQLAGTLSRHFVGKGRVRLLSFDAERLPVLKWELSRGGELFPHLYGRLDIGLVKSEWWLEVGQDGIPVMPEELG